MLRLVLSSVRHNRGRYVATLVAIITGVAFYAATGFVSDRVIDTLEGNVDDQYGAVDIAIVPVQESSGLSSADDLSSEIRIPSSRVTPLLREPGVEGGAGTLTGRVAFQRGDRKPFATDATGRMAISDADLDPLDYVDGRAPRGGAEVAVDRGTADDRGVAVGDHLTLLTLAGKFPVTISGVTRFGDADALDDGGTVTIPPAAAFRWLGAGRQAFEEFYLRVSGSADAVRDRIRGELPVAYDVQSGDDFRKDKRESVGAIGRYLKYALQAFAILALLVGGFVIYNTFSVIVAQRMRELAVLAAIGATPKQLRTSLRREGLVLGLVGSGLGVVAGVALTFVLIAVLKALGVELPGSGLSVTGPTVIGGVLIGTLITRGSVALPARRASRIEPMAALRDAATDGGTITTRRRRTAVILVVAGLAGLLVGPAAGWVGLGAVAFMGGVIAAGPLIAVLGARVARRPLTRFGIEGRLAADNSARNPKRTATTANALLIGVFLVTFVTVAGTSVKDFAVDELNAISSADYLVTSEGGTIDDRLVADLRALDGVTRVEPFRRAVVSEDRRTARVSTGDLDVLQDIADVEVQDGRIDDLGPDTIAVLDDGSDKTPELGDSVTLVAETGRRATLRVVARLRQSTDSVEVGNVVDRATFDRLVGDIAPTVAFLSLASGDQTATRTAIERRVEERPDITLTEGNQLGRLIGSIFDFMINAVVGLLMMSVLIALIGIVNTLSLSILERRRELGLLRAVGMTDDRIRRMVRLESLLMALLGTVTGMVCGLVVSGSLVLAINRLTDAGIGLSFPVLELSGVLVAGIVLGVIAALIPARRSTRVDVLDAIGAA